MEDFRASRRDLLAFGAGAAALGASPAIAAGVGEPMPLSVLDPVRTELAMNLIVTCSSPARMGPGKKAKDGERPIFWPIIGGRFWGPRIRGKVIAGGADFPVIRPDGIEVIDAFYRLQADDGTIIIIHNVGLTYPKDAGGHQIFRLAPTFTTVEGPHDWLNKSIFISTLIGGADFPKELAMAKGPNENDRLIQVHRVF